MPAFEYRPAQEIRDGFASTMFAFSSSASSGAILLGFPDTTQDADLFVEKSVDNCRALVAACANSASPSTDEQAAEIMRGKDFIQLKNGPFDLGPGLRTRWD